jgi:hypothetical protein
MDCVRVNPAFRPASIGEVMKRLEPYGAAARP